MGGGKAAMHVSAESEVGAGANGNAGRVLLRERNTSSRQGPHPPAVTSAMEASSLAPNVAVHPQNPTSGSPVRPVGMQTEPLTIPGRTRSN